MSELIPAEAPQGEMTGMDDAPVTVERVFRGQDILRELKAQEPMPYHDGSAPSVVKKVLAAAKTAVDPDFAAYTKLARDPNYRPVRAFSRSQAERLGLLTTDRTSQLDRLMDAAPTAERHEAALVTGQSMPLPMLADPGEKHDLPPGCKVRTVALTAGERQPLAELPPTIPLDADRLDHFKKVADDLESGRT